MSVDGSVVGVHYDSMLAKLIAWAPTRAEAARLLAGALARRRAARCRHQPGPAGPGAAQPRVPRRARSTPGSWTGTRRSSPRCSPADQRTPGRRWPRRWPAAAARRAAAPVLAGAALRLAQRAGRPRRAARFAGPDGEIEVRYRLDRTGALADWSTVTPASPDGPGEPERPQTAVGDRRRCALVSGHPGPGRARRGRRPARVPRTPGGAAVFVDGPDGAVDPHRAAAFPAADGRSWPTGSLLAPLPGAVDRVHVEVGQRVAAGDLLLTLEAMKLEHPVLAPADGVVAELPVPAGGQVDTGTVLAVVNARP